MIRRMTVIVDARRYEDDDDCLRAAADDVSRALNLRGHDLDPGWGDDKRATITMTVPRPDTNDAIGWDRLRSLDCISCTEARS